VYVDVSVQNVSLGNTPLDHPERFPRGVPANGSDRSRAALLIGRIRLDDASREVAAALRSGAVGLQRLAEPSRADILAGVRRNLRRWGRWVVTGVTPADAEFEPLRTWARARAKEGVRLEDLIRAFGVARQVGWELIRAQARPDEQAALLEAAGLLMRYVDRICAVVADAYLAGGEPPVSEVERHIRDLVERLSDPAPLDAYGHDLARRLRVEVRDRYAPFVVALPGQQPDRHAALAAGLRQRGWPLAVTDGTRVSGLAGRPPTLAEAGGPDAILVVAGEIRRADLAAARRDVVLLTEYARRAGRRGRICVEEHQLELLMCRQPTLVRQLRERVFARLTDAEELVHTVRAFVVRNYDRAAASRALHIHRNTLGYRLHRVERLTGLDLAQPRALAVLYLAVAAEHCAAAPERADEFGTAPLMDRERGS
jgi:PucR-like helix-turn-helix protein